jgi:hypothetical protein
MPEEVAIALVVLFAIVWLIYKVVKGIAAVAQTAKEEFTSTIGSAQNRRFQKNRSAQVDHVRILLPDELKAAEQRLQAVEEDLITRRQSSVWVPERPSWDKLAFSLQRFVIQGASSRELDVADLDSILRPDPQSWCVKEQALLSQPCSYPALLSDVKRSEFIEFEPPALSLEPAVFEVDRSKVHEEKIDRFWGKEREAVAAYNRQRDSLLSKHKTLIDEISAWNREERARWLQYSEKCDALAKDEGAQLKMHAAKFEADCTKQKATVSQVLEGFRKKIKPLVLKRVEFILSSITLPSSLPRLWEIDYDEQEQILIVEIALPNVVHHPPVQRKNHSIRPNVRN